MKKKYFAKGLYVLADFEPQSNENADFSFMAVRGYGYDRITRISGAVDREMVFLFWAERAAVAGKAEQIYLFL